MKVSGLLVGVRRYSFNDKDSGQLVSGCKVALGVEPDNADGAGYIVQDISAPYGAYDKLAAAANKFAGAHVTVECEIQLKGRYTKLSAVEIQGA